MAPIPVITYRAPSRTSAPFAIRHGLGYGMVPESLAQDALAQGEVVDLAKNAPLDISLYWHTWKVQSPRMEHLSRQIIEAAPRILAPPAAGVEAE